MEENLNSEKGTDSLRGNISAWALALGCIIGWGAFVMPGSTFLPKAGPLGTAIGVAIAALMMLVVAYNYSYVARHYPGEGGTYLYAKETIGEDHAFLAVWSLLLAYMSLLWANATAFILIGRYVLGDVLQKGPMYSIAGYDVYLTEVAVTIMIEVAFGLMIYYARKAACQLRNIFAVVLMVSVILLFIGVFLKEGTDILYPGFAAEPAEAIQILNVLTLAPWMFVGFESVVHIKCNKRKTDRGMFALLGVAILCGMMIYVMLGLVGTAGTPERFEDWREYVGNLDGMEGLEALPVFNGAKMCMGSSGLILVSLAAVSALATSLLGFYHASAGVMRTMAAEGLLPERMGEETEGFPRKAIIVIMLISLPIPFLGRTAVGWNADVSTLSVAIVYAYISISTMINAGKERNTAAKVMGALGLVISAAVFLMLLVPNIFMDNALATESYLMLAAWSLVGIIYYWAVFRKDKDNRFGKSTVMWVMTLFLLFFSINVWIRLHTQEKLGSILGESGEVEAILTSDSLVLMGTFIVVLVIMFNLFSIMEKNREEMALKVIQAEERDKAKTAFLSNMSHDIRTPMNAIIGFTELAMKNPDDADKVKEYLFRIRGASDHLLTLINDVLEMSRIESGKIELDESVADIREIISGIDIIMTSQAESKHQNFTVEVVDAEDIKVVCDKLRMDQILLNLISNAIKYTPEGGNILLTVRQTGREEGNRASYEFRVKDDGIGMSDEFASRIFEAFEREKNSTISGIQGTGLGMAITKRIVDLMGGTIDVNTAPGKGTEFVVRLSMAVAETEEPEVENLEVKAGSDAQQEIIFEGKRVLLVDDIEINREIAKTVLSMSGFEVHEASNGQEAVENVQKADAGFYDVVLMDIQMPVMNGYDAARAIRELSDKEKASVPVIAMTANAFDEDKKMAYEAGMNGHIAKPLDTNQLLSTLGNILK